MSSTSSFGYQPAHPSLAKDNSQKYEFDSPATIAKQQQFQPAGGFQQAGGLPLPPAYPTSTSQARPLQPNRAIRLRTRDWSGQPWGGSNQLQSDSYAPPSSLMSDSWLSSRPGLLSSLPSSGFSQSGSHSSGLPTTNYQPSSTIPRQHNYHLPSSSLAHSSGPMDSSLNKDYNSGLQSNLPSQSLNKDYANYQTYGLNLDNNNSGLQNYQNYGLSKNIDAPLSKNLGSQNLGSGFSGIPQAPPMPTWNRNSTRSRSAKPLRTRNWGNPSDQGWTGLNRNNLANEQFLSNKGNNLGNLNKLGNQQSWNNNLGNQQSWNNNNLGNQQSWNNSASGAPMAPRLPSFLRARTWTRGPYRQRPLRTRNWGLRGENGWSHFNRGIYAHESALPFNSNRSRNISWADQPSSSATTQTFTSAPIAPISAAPIAPIAVAPIATALAPIAAPLKGRKGRRAARKEAKAIAIQEKLTTQLNPPIGDPAVNHYRRGAKATVPITGPATGIAPPVGSIASRRVGRRNNLGRRRGRLAAPAIPVPATQPPFVAAQPVLSAPISTFPQASYRTVYSNPSNISTYAVQPSSFTSAPLSSSAGIPLSTSGIQQPLYSSATMQSRPLSSTLTNSQGTVSNAPLYSAKEPVAAQLLTKPAQAPLAMRPIGSATF